MSLTAPYDPDNIFAKIIRGDIPCTKVFEDDECLAFMDLYPQSPGHCLVISKTAPAANILTIETQRLEALVARVQAVTKAVNTALSPDGIRIAQFNGAPAGQTVFHLHFHIIPVYEGDEEKTHGAQSNEDGQNQERLAGLIRDAL